MARPCLAAMHSLWEKGFTSKGQKGTPLATGIKIPFLFEPLLAFDSQLSCLRMARYA